MPVCGPSQSRKSTFVHALLVRKISDVPPPKIYWFYGEYCDELMSKPYICISGLPDSFSDVEDYSVVVLDDLMKEGTNHAGITALFTKLVHHRKLFVIILTQNFYEQSKEARTRRLNTQYIVLFKNPADQTHISVLGRQMYPDDTKFIPAVYKEVTQRPHGYIFIDLRQETPDDLLRSDILGNFMLYVDKHSLKSQLALRDYEGGES